MGGPASRQNGGATAPHRSRRERTARRTQSERSALTREKVIQAVVDCIVEDGFTNATAARIAERAGVTWGAIVHQFGDKDSVLLAVLERNLGSLSSSVTEALATGARGPRERVALLIDEMWRRLTAPSFRAFLEIVLNRRPAPGDALKARQEELIHGASRRIWMDLFREFGTDADTIDVTRTLTSAAVLGLAILAIIGPHKPDFTRELATLRGTVLHLLELTGGSAQRRAR